MDSYRTRFLELVGNLYAGTITHRQFNDALPPEVSEDLEMDELIDTILHEPHVGWFLGVSEEQGQKNRAEILRRLEELRRASSNEKSQAAEQD